MHIIWILVKILILAISGYVSLKLAARFACVNFDKNTILFIGAVTSLIMIIPWAGFLLSAFFIISMSKWFSDADFYPDACLIAGIATPCIYLIRLILYF